MEMKWMPANVRPDIREKINRIVEDQCPGEWWEDAVCYVLAHLPEDVQEELLLNVELRFSFLGGAFRGGRNIDRRKTASPPTVLILLQKNLDVGWSNSAALEGLISHELAHVYAKTEEGAHRKAKEWGFSYPHSVLLRQKAYNGPE